MTKYNSKKVTIDNHTFDSKQEADYYLYLNEKLKRGEIIDFTLQPVYILIPKFTKFNKKYREMTYTPDFEIHHLDNTIELIDVKGFSVATSEMRRKLFNYYYPNILLTWVSYSKKYGGWIEIEELAKLRKLNKKMSKADKFSLEMSIESGIM